MRKRMLTTIALTAASILAIGLGLLVLLAHLSKSGRVAGLASGRLQACSDKPNCVCSEFPEKTRHYVEPLVFSPASPEQAWQALKRAIRDCGGRIVTDAKPYLAATFSSSLFGFVDDFECRLDEAGKIIHVRSSSRVGYSDLGKNRQRVADVARAFADRMQDTH